MARKGFLLVLMQPPASMDDEFNAWYDSEHVPERLAVPGVETAIRYSSAEGVPNYLAIYDLVDKSVLDTEAYLKVAGDRSSPWTKRVTGRTNVYRSVGDQVYPGDAVTPLASRVTIVRFRALPAAAEPGVVKAMRAAFEDRPSTIGVRVFAYPIDGTVDYIGFVSSAVPDDSPLDPKLFKEFFGAIDLVNTYMPRPR
jgi:hypothetical protein